MACRALCRSIHRSARSLVVTRSFSPHYIQSNPISFHLQAVSHTGALLSYHFPSLNSFSSTPQLSNAEDQADEEVSHRLSNAEIAGSVKQGSISSSNAQELAADPFLEIPSPVDLTTACLDALHSITGLPWWATISLSAVLLRTLILPFKFIQTRKLAEIRDLGPKLQPERLVKGLLQGKFLEECRQLRKREQELSAPSILWVFGPGIFLQVPLFFMIVRALRRMALEQHLGFTMGGIMWFQDLTVPGQGLVGAVLPLTVAAVYFANVHVLFERSPIRKELLGDIDKAVRIFLKCSTFFIFWFSYYAPQALHAFLVPHSIMTLSQTALFENEKFVKRVVGPRPRPRMNDTHKVPGLLGDQHLMASSRYEKLLKDAGTFFSTGNSFQAIELLKAAIEEWPDKGEPYALLGLVYKSQKDWVNSALYYKQAISKGETDDFKIAVYAGCGLALLKKGSTMECVETVRPIRNLKVPEHPDSRHCYYASLVILGRALLEAGLNDESQEVVRLYKELEMEGTKGQSS